MNAAIIHRALRLKTSTPSPFDISKLHKLGVGISSLTADSRTVTQGMTFAAFRGEAVDGRNYIADAISRGAKAVLWDSDNFSWPAHWQVPNLGIANLQQYIGSIASHVYGNPSQKLWVAGVTGTNGKTSCSHWIASAFSFLGKKSAVIGTVGNGLAGSAQQLTEATHTTPEAIGLQAMLRDFLQQGATHVAMEASSHGLEQGRVNGVKFDVALFTNLTRDHLDYHGDMESYAKAKHRLFHMPQLKTAVVNIDDEYGARLVQELKSENLEVITYSLKLGDICGSHLSLTLNGMELDITSRWGNGRLKSRLLGAFNASNLLGVMGVLLAGGVSFSDAIHALAQLDAPPGRLQQLGGGDKPLVVVDYAHTPDALEKVLLTLRKIVPANGQLVCLFGCGGDRDKGKRPLMGAISAKLADISIITSDNPRSENPAQIMEQIVAGMGNAKKKIQSDRASAISQAIDYIDKNYILLIAGKGHEETQEIAGVKTPFSDVQHAAAALQKKYGH
ncbi:MAG: UDP-N-acetylmuramoyl-L-alanyl-D-glutamate--2,6-diaminopimelate ligase [Burkholderiales bacterium]